MTLQKLRRLHKISQLQMAQRLGMSRPGIARIEQGAHTSTATLLAYSEGLGYDFLTVVSAWQAGYKASRDRGDTPPETCPEND